MTQKKLPAIMFYTGDWLKEPTLRATSLEARGLWVDMLCFMHESPIRGYLMLTQDVPMLPEHLARASGISPDACGGLLAELQQNGVLSVVELDGVGPAYTSRRMVRDELTRQKLSDAGKRGGRPRESQGKASAKPTPKGQRGSSSSTSLSDSNSTEETRAAAEAIFSRIPWRARKQPAKTKKAIEHVLLQFADSNRSHSGDIQSSCKWLGDRITDYYLSAEGRSEFHRSPFKWLEDEGYDEPDEVWAARFKERDAL